MSRFKNGVSYYTIGKMVAVVHFPEDEVTCFHCWMRDNDTIGRPVCRALNRELYYIKEGRHEDCPLTIERKDENNESIQGAE